jgi:hypothetical protein
LVVDGWWEQAAGNRSPANYQQPTTNCFMIVKGVEQQ